MKKQNPDEGKGCSAKESGEAKDTGTLKMTTNSESGLV